MKKIIAGAVASILTASAGASVGYVATNNYNQAELNDVKTELVRVVEQKDETIKNLESDNVVLQESLDNSISSQAVYIPYSNSEDIGLYKKVGDSAFLYYKSSESDYVKIEQDFSTYFTYLTDYYVIDDTQCLIFTNDDVIGSGIILYDKSNHTFSYVLETSTLYNERLYVGDGLFLLSSCNKSTNGLYYFSVDDFEIHKICDFGYYYGYCVWLNNDSYLVYSTQSGDCIILNINDMSYEDVGEGNYYGTVAYSYENFVLFSSGRLYNRLTNEFTESGLYNVRYFNELPDSEKVVAYDGSHLRTIDINDVSISEDIILDPAFMISNVFCIYGLDANRFFISWSDGSYRNGCYNFETSTFTQYPNSENRYVTYMERLSDDNYCVVLSNINSDDIYTFNSTTETLTPVFQRALVHSNHGYYVFLNRYVIAISNHSSYPGVYYFDLESGEFVKYGDFMNWDKTMIAIDDNSYIVVPSKFISTNFVVAIDVLENDIDISLALLV